MGKMTKKTVGAKVTLKPKISWWLNYLYLPLVRFLSMVTGLEPDKEKLEFWIRKGIKIKIESIDFEDNQK